MFKQLKSKLRSWRLRMTHPQKREKGNLSQIERELYMNGVCAVQTYEDWAQWCHEKLDREVSDSYLRYWKLETEGHYRTGLYTVLKYSDYLDWVPRWIEDFSIEELQKPLSANGWTILMGTMKWNRVSIMNALLKRGVNSMQVDEWGYSAWHYAAESQAIDCWKEGCKLSSKAWMFLRNKNGDLPIDLWMKGSSSILESPSWIKVDPNREVYRRGYIESVNMMIEEWDEDPEIELKAQWIDRSYSRSKDWARRHLRGEPSWLVGYWKSQKEQSDWSLSLDLAQEKLERESAQRGIKRL